MLQFLGKINRSPVCASLVCRARRLGSSFKTLWTFSWCMTERTGGKDEEKRNSTSLKNKKTGGKLFSRSLLCWRSLKKTLQIFFSDTLKKKKKKSFDEQKFQKSLKRERRAKQRKIIQQESALLA